MTITSPAHPGPANLDALEAFMEYPAALALLDTAGRVERANLVFLARLGDDELAEAALRALAHDPDGAWRSVRLGLKGETDGTTRVRAIRTSNRILLILDDPGGAGHGGEVDALLARITALERLASTDHLTGAWNRAHLDRVIDAELARSRAGRYALSLVLFDIDHFKAVNDTFGHAVGDSVLRELVQVVRSHTRASDLLFRWGGEEFVVLLPSTGYRRAEGVAENLRTVVASHAFAEAGAVSMSLGVAEHDGDEDAAAWFRRLDEALYEAKESGRNRVVVSRRGSSDAWAAQSGSSALHLVWEEGYECGDPTIDAEHRELFRLANLLIDAALRNQSGPAAVKTALDELLAHVQRHFADEEAILERLGYDGLAEHRRAHAGLIRRALAMSAKLEAGQAGVGAIVEFLAQDVVARHLLAMDRAFFPLLRKASRG